MSDCQPIKNCIACGSDMLSEVLDLDTQPLANDYKNTKDEVQQEFPLAINRCTVCDHVQLTHQVNPELMFKNYAYVSGVSQTLKDWFTWLISYTNQTFDGTINNTLDIGCNDGSMLDAWSNNVETYGVDPAENLHSISTGKGHKVHCGFFSGKEFEGKTFDVITCLNAFAHNANQLELLKNVKEVMHDNSVLICSTSQADMIRNGEFDTIYHEHVSFYNILSAKRISERAGLNLIDVVKHPIHGNSFIFFMSKNKKNQHYIDAMLEIEQLTGLHDDKVYKEFAEKAYNTANTFGITIRSFRGQYPIIGYSAPAKGMTLMNFAKEGPDVIFEDTIQKQGKFTPGLGIPIIAPDYKAYENEERVVWVVLAWNVYDEIVAKIKSNRPGKNDIFVRYYPTFEVIT
jgi:2-polyprenyl-3-methyl-5-hydroxy-6-metoxy-1,4-benzoquinol methylase